MRRWPQPSSVPPHQLFLLSGPSASARPWLAHRPCPLEVALVSCVVTATMRLQLGAALGGLTVLADHPHDRLFRCATETLAVLQEALLAAEKVEGDAGDGNVGDCLEGGAKTAVDAIDVADRFDVDLTFEV